MQDTADAIPATMLVHSYEGAMYKSWLDPLPARASVRYRGLA
jgi:hypothetical protein